LGFTPDSSLLFARALLRIAEMGKVVETVGTPFGTKYVVEGNLETPRMERVRLITVWIILAEENVPRFVTAYPGRRSGQHHD
jgi:hypothetical protein